MAKKIVNNISYNDLIFIYYIKKIENGELIYTNNMNFYNNMKLSFRMDKDYYHHKDYHHKDYDDNIQHIIKAKYKLDFDAFKIQTLDLTIKRYWKLKNLKNNDIN